MMWRRLRCRGVAERLGSTPSAQQPDLDLVAGVEVCDVLAERRTCSPPRPARTAGATPARPRAPTVPGRRRPACPRRNWRLPRGESTACRSGARTIGPGRIAVSHRGADRRPEEHLERDVRAHRVARQRHHRHHRAAAPAPCGMPGCMATLANSMPCPVSASLTTSYAPAETPPEVTIRSCPPRRPVERRTQRVDVVGDEVLDRRASAPIAAARRPASARWTRRSGPVPAACRAPRVRCRWRAPAPASVVARDSSAKPSAAATPICVGPITVPAGSTTARGDVLAAGPDVHPGSGSTVDADPLGAAVGALDLDDGVRTGRQRGAGHDSRRGSGGERLDVGSPGRDVLRHRQRDGQVRDIDGPDRVSVHRRVANGGRSSAPPDRRPGPDPSLGQRHRAATGIGPSRSGDDTERVPRRCACPPSCPVAATRRSRSARPASPQSRDPRRPGWNTSMDERAAQPGRR